MLDGVQFGPDFRVDFPGPHDCGDFGKARVAHSWKAGSRQNRRNQVRPRLRVVESLIGFGHSESLLRSQGIDQ